MSGSAAFEAYGSWLSFGWVVIGVIAMVAVAIRREEQRCSLSGAAPGPVAGARWLTGLGSLGTHYRPRGCIAAQRTASDGALVIAFFVIGIVFGVVIVLAISILRRAVGDGPGRPARLRAARPAANHLRTLGGTACRTTAARPGTKTISATGSPTGGNISRPRAGAGTRGPRPGAGSRFVTGRF